MQSRRHPIPSVAAAVGGHFLVVKAFVLYLHSPGSRTSALPDLVIALRQRSGNSLCPRRGCVACRV